ncbi:glutaminyl-peptide cyclotransferase [Flavisolibacter sp. BT320]|nr:glutaminyl-peptide cyclotransferase [Flavisolibacter longurius]
MKKISGLALLAAALLLTRCANNDAPSDTTTAAPQTPSIAYTVVNTYPHDTSHFIQGFEFYKGDIIEGTGLEGKSKLLQYDLETGTVKKSISLPATSFGEGVTVFRDTVYQLTYRESKVNVYRASDFGKIGELPFTGEGWGLTNDSTALIASNGSNNLYYYEPGTFKLLKKVAITENEAPAVNLNELEYINGFVYANQWQMNYILKIDPAAGNVVAKLDLSGVVQQEKALNPYAEFINGIAYNKETGKVYITGKNWSKIYQLQFQF